MNKRSLKVLPQMIALLFIITAFAGLYIIHTGWNYEGRFWQNWYPVLIEQNQISTEIESEIQKLSGDGAVSKSNTILKYSNYRDLESLSLNELSQGKGPYKEDPRIDPYMSGITAYFNQNIYEIFYLPSDKSPLEYQRLFSASPVLADINWILPDWNDRTAHILLYATVLLLLCFGSLRFCITAGGFAAAGFMVHAQGQSGLLIALAVTALYLRLFSMKYHRLSWYFILPFIPPVTAYFMELLQIRHLLLTGLVFLAFAGTSLWPLKKSGSRSMKLRIKKTDRVHSGKDHSLFEPVSLFAEQGDVKTPAGERPSLYLLSAAVLCLILCIYSLPGEKVLPAGIPSAEKSEGFWNYDGLVQTQSSGQLPGASEYLKHRAYQEAFIYGGAYALPVPGSVISFEDYHFSDGRVFETNPSVLLFTESWYESRLIQMAESGPGKLLASESSPPVISFRNTMNVGISLQLLFVFAVLIIVFVLIQVSGAHHASQSSGIRSNGKFVLRRKQQAA